MILATLFGFIYAFKITAVYAKVITWASVVAVSVMLIGNERISIDGYYLFGLVQIGILVYSASDFEFSSLKKAVLTSSAICTLVPLAFFISGTYAFGSISLAMAVIQLGIFSYALTKIIKELKEEMGFLVIVSTDAAIRIAGMLMFYMA